ncbi:MAG: 3D domain-containing protein [Fervidobacterium nodosum]
MARNKRVGILKTMILFLLFIIFLSLYGCFPLGNYFELSMRIEELESRVDNIEQSYGQSVSDKIKGDKEIVGIKNNISEIKSNVEMIDKKVVNLNSQVINLNDKVSSLQKDVSAIKADLPNVKANLSDLEKKLTSTNNSMTKLSNQVSDLDKRLSNFENKTVSDISTLSKRVTTLENNNSSINTKLFSIENQLKVIDNIKKDLDVLSAQIRELKSLSQLSIQQSDIEFIKQLQQEIQDLKSTIQSMSIEELLKIKEGYIYYLVKSGDTLSSIANAYGVKVDALSQVNNITDPSKIAIGQLIKIPVNDPSKYYRVPVKIVPSDILKYHGQEVNGNKTVGIDIYARGQDVYPILPGKVISVDGYRVTIDHGNMIMAVYDGINTTVKQGTFVTNNKPLGQCIDVFHFELYIDGEPRDPLRLFTEYKGIFTVTFYSEWDDGKVPSHPTFRIARNGRVPSSFRTIAVDPTVIPLGSLVYIPTLSNVVFIAEDTGSAIKGNRIDVYVSDVRLALNQGISAHPVYILYPQKNVQ